jgi:hypothetical protein
VPPDIESIIIIPFPEEQFEGTLSRFSTKGAGEVIVIVFVMGADVQ